jgi:predicted membrane protein (TIGR00267 family)
MPLFVPFHPVRKWIKTAREYSAIADIGEIARRYFAMNAFDGVLTIMGVLMGSMGAGVSSAHVVVTTGLTTCIAMGISGLWGSYLTESAERKRDLDELGSQTLTDLKKSKLGRASRYAVVMIAIIDGLSPFLAALLVLIPFFLADLLPSIQWAYLASLGGALLALFGLGVFLGNISRENLLLSGAKTVVAGLLSILIGALVGHIR